MLRSEFSRNEYRTHFLLWTWTLYAKVGALLRWRMQLCLSDSRFDGLIGWKDRVLVVIIVDIQVKIHQMAVDQGTNNPVDAFLAFVSIFHWPYPYPRGIPLAVYIAILGGAPIEDPREPRSLSILRPLWYSKGESRLMRKENDLSVLKWIFSLKSDGATDRAHYGDQAISGR